MESSGEKNESEEAAVVHGTGGSCDAGGLNRWWRAGRKTEEPLIGNGSNRKEAYDFFRANEMRERNLPEAWLPRVSGALKSLSISDFWVQSCCRQSEVLSMVSACCHKLLELEVKNAWLSLENLNPMPMLTSLTLERIRLDDNDISQVNKCLPNLQVLNLIDIEGLEVPIIRLLNLKTCHWTVDHWSSMTLITPNLITLRLECIRLATLYVQAPMLSHFHLALDYAGVFFVKEFENLKTLLLESSYMYSLIIKFPRIETIENLTLNSRDSHIRSSKFTLKNLLAGFRTVTSLCLNSRVWTEFETCYDPFNRVVWEGRNGLKTFCGYLLLVDPSLTFTIVAWLLDQCFNLVDVSDSSTVMLLLMYPEVSLLGVWLGGLM
ncbi:hypothetical protein L1887_38136 [Cichorium endivia]|nr:hypothetical protein L1887_38136 [Cichorium endivia]